MPTTPARLLTLEINANIAHLNYEENATGGKLVEKNVTAAFTPPPPAEVARAWELMRDARLKDKVVQDELEKIGQRLYQHLLPGAVGEAFEKVWQAGQPLQLHLVLPDAALQFVPWEYLANQRGFLATRPRFALSRHVTPEEVSPLAPALVAPLRLLVVVASPLNLEAERQLDSDREVMLIRQGLKPLLTAGEIEMELEDVASVNQLKATLDEFKPHVVHFSGHGYFDVLKDAADKPYIESGLLLEDADGNKLKVKALEIARTLAGRAELQLVVLSACVTALPDTGKAITSTAAELIREGVPAVIAMQESIRDDSATLITQNLYPALAKGETVGAALAKARDALAGTIGREGKPSDWAMPVLVTGQPALPLFNFTQPGQPRPRAVVTGTSISVISEDNYFVGRQKERRTLRFAMRGDEAKIAIVAGLGGLGKSTLVQNTLERLATNFSHVHRERCKAEMVATELMRNLADNLAYAPLKETLASPTELASQQLGLLTAQTLNATNCLWVLDNFEDLLDYSLNPVQLHDKELASWLENVLLNLKEGRVIITTRYDFSFTDRHQGAIKLLTLDKLAVMEMLRLSGEYLNLARLPREERMRHYELGLDNPFIIGLADSYLGTGGGLPNLLDRVQKSYSEKMLLEKLYATLSLAGQSLFRRMAIYREAVPVEFLARLQSGASGELAALIARQLAQRQIVPTGDSEGDELYSQHQTVRYFGLEKLRQVETETGLQAAHLLAAQHYQYFLINVSHDTNELIEVTHHMAQGGKLAEAVALVRGLNPQLERQGLWRLGLALNRQLNRFIATGSSDDTVDLVDKADLLKNEADRMAGLGQVSAAIRLYEQALGLVQQAGNRQGEGASYGSLGNAYISLGQYHKAIECCVQASLILVQIQSPNIQQVLNIMRGICQKLGVAEFEQLVERVCTGNKIDYRQYRGLLAQGGVFEAKGQAELPQQLQQVGQLIGLTLKGEEQARQLLEQQFLPQLEKEESGFGNLAGLVRLFLAGEQDQRKLQAAAAKLDETDQAIMQLAYAVAQNKAKQPRTKLA